MSSPLPLHVSLGEVDIAIYDGYTRTTFADGAFLDACHEDVRGLGQAETARDLGYETLGQMNHDHDVCHSMLAVWLGLRRSPTLYALAYGLHASQAELEEAAVLAIQQFAVACNVDLVSVAQRLARLLQGARHA